MLNSYEMCMTALLQCQKIKNGRIDQYDPLWSVTIWHHLA